MPLVNPDPLRFPGSASTAGGTSAVQGSSTDEATTWIQNQPWYRDTLAQWGNPQTLSLGQRGYLTRTAQQAGLDTSFGIAADGSVEDWSTPTAAKIGLAAFGAAAGGAAMGAFSGGSGAAAASGGAGVPFTASGAGTVGGDVVGAGAAAGLPNWLKTAQDVGQNLAGLASGRAQGRAMDAFANQNQNRSAVDLYNTELNAPRTIARNAVKGDILSNAQDATISGVSPNIPIPTISGGLRPSMFSDATRQTGRNISTAAANTPIPSPTAPVLPPLPQSNGFDTFLNTAGTIGGLARPIGGLIKQIPWGS